MVFSLLAGVSSHFLVLAMWEMLLVVVVAAVAAVAVLLLFVNTCRFDPLECPQKFGSLK
jgi:hypothetical protein